MTKSEKVKHRSLMSNSESLGLKRQKIEIDLAIHYGITMIKCLVPFV
jgi:hypothetical protein